MSFTLQGFGPFLHWLTLAILCVLPVIVGIALYKLGGMPGAIATARNHPQAAAINVCGWMGLITLVLWPIAMVWAHTRRDPATDSGTTADITRSVSGALQQASQRLAALEAELTTPPAARGG